MLIGPTVLPGKRFVLIGNLTTYVTPTQLTTLPRPGLIWPGLAWPGPGSLSTLNSQGHLNRASRGRALRERQRLDSAG